MNSLPRLSHQLVLEGSQEVSDGAGGIVTSWVPLGILWGELQSRSGRKSASGALSKATTIFQITVRSAPVGHSARPRPNQRFRLDDRIFNITSVIENSSEPMYLTCAAQEEFAI